MLKPMKMQKVRIVALKSIIDDLIRLLHEMGMVEINKIGYSELDGGRPLDFYNDISEQLIRIRAIKNNLATQKTEIKEMDGKKALDEARKLKIDEELKEYVNEISKIESEVSNLREDLKTLETLCHVSDVDFSELTSDSIDYLVGTIPSKNLKSTNKRLNEITKVFTERITDTGEKDSLLLVVYKKTDEDIEANLSDFGFTKIDVPEGTTYPSHSRDAIEKEIRERLAKIEEIKKEKDSLSVKYYGEVASIERALSIEADRAEIASRFNFSSNVFVLEGWMKETEVRNLGDSLDKYGNKVIFDKVETEHDEMPPTVLKNPDYASQLQFITKSYSLPNAKEIDPTMLYFITLPIIYGMIVGDVVYGILSLIIASFLMKKFKNSETMFNVAKIWYISAFPTMLFGILFDEWMGMSHLALLQLIAQWGLNLGITASLYLGFHRVHQLPMLIGFTAIVGLIHLGIGFILGAVNEWYHNRKHAIAKIAWLGVEIGGTLAVTAFMLSLLPADAGSIGLGILVISIIVLFWGEGIVGLLELPGLAGNVLSYARIAAIGIVGVILAEIINMLAPTPSQGFLVFLTIPIFFILHTVNAFIAMFEALIQGGRLNILEFRSKFLKGGGRLFSPFTVNTKQK